MVRARCALSGLTPRAGPLGGDRVIIHIERIELHFVLARVQRVEIGDAVDAEHDRFAVDYKVLLPVVPIGNLIRLAREAESRNASVL